MPDFLCEKGEIKCILEGIANVNIQKMKFLGEMANDNASCALEMYY